MLLMLSWAVGASAQTPAAGVSSAVPGTAAPATTGSTKPLPWKLLASPMGVLNANWTPAELLNFSNPDKWSCQKEPVTCTPKQVKRLVLATIGTDLDQSHQTYVAIHFVDYASGSGTTLKDWWYLYHSKDSKWTFQKFSSQRIYGSPSVLFVFVHLNVKGLSESGPIFPGLAGTVQASLKKGSAPSAGKILCADDTSSRFVWVGNGAVVDDYAKTRYEEAVVKRTPANIANLLSILKILGIGANAEANCQAQQTESVNLWGAGRIDDIGLPSDVSIAGYAVNKTDALKDEDRSVKQIGSVGAFNDEQLYWWDASVGIPVHKIKDLQYSESDNTVVASQVDKQSAYAMFNLMLHPVDLSNPKSNVWPRLLVGFPLSSSPWDSLFAGGGIGIPWKPVQNFQFFAGVAFNRGKQPTTLNAGSSATNAQLQNDLQVKTTPKFTFGINVPVKSVLDKLLK
jgi:hypothetical protein